MPWVRIDENAIDHPKFLALSDGAWRLWCEGQTYCQKHLTDGVIGAAALRRFRYYSQSRVKNLTFNLVPGKGPCWHQQLNGDIHVHDYLDWNESAAEVLKARSDAKNRRRRYEERNASGNASLNASGMANVSSDVGYGNGSEVKEGSLRETNASADSLSERAGLFTRETYPELYQKYRKGARYVSKPALDFQEALLLCQTWDDERLAKIATVFLTTDHDFAENGSRTMAQFRAMASWCDSRLRESGL